MNILKRHSIFFYLLALSFIVFHSLSFSFVFFRFLSFSFVFFRFLSFSHIFFLFLSCSFMFFAFSFHFLFFPFVVSSFFFFLFFFARVLKILFFASIASRFPTKAVIGPLFFSSSLTFFHFRLLFQFLSMFFLFSFVFPCNVFLYFPFVFLSKKCFILFHFVSLFSFLRCSKSVAALQDSLGKSAHSELALFALYWIVVTFHVE